MNVTIGSLFAGIGGFELGLERSIPGAETIWQVEQDKHCLKVLAKHWPGTQRFTDVREVGAHNLATPTILTAGFPCQDFSISGKGEGLNGAKSSLWLEARRIISELRPRVFCLENVPAITFRGGSTVIENIAELGYSAEWQIISARERGAPHLRNRWFCVAYTDSTSGKREPLNPLSLESKIELVSRSSKAGRDNFEGHWQKEAHPEPVICRMANGLSSGMDRARLKALGNAIVPQCTELLGKYINDSGILD